MGNVNKARLWNPLPESEENFVCFWVSLVERKAVVHSVIRVGRTTPFSHPPRN